MLKKFVYFYMILTFTLTGCAKLPESYNKVYSKAFTDVENTLLAKAIHIKQKTQKYQSGFYILGNGIDAFIARAALAELAEKSLDVQYYIFHNDLIGNLFTYQLLKAADKGVRVRLLLDDLNMGEWDDDLMAINKHPNIEVRLFNPFNRKTSRATQLITHERAITRRMHNKSFTADNLVTIIGGRNIGDEYFNADPSVIFEDLDVLGIGKVAKDVSKSFDKYWNSELSYPIDILTNKKLSYEEYNQAKKKFNKFMKKNTDSKYLQALKKSNFLKNLLNEKLKYYWGEAQVVYDDPNKILVDLSNTKYNLTPQLKPFVDSISKELIILSPYFVPGKTGSQFLVDLVKKGVKVRILTNSLASNDVGLVHAGYSKYRK
jgi:putative cardiolipin synthase